MAKRLATSIAGGAWTQVQVKDAEGALHVIGLAQGASYNEDFNVQPLETLNHLGPVEYESFGYSCEITIRWLVAKNKADFAKLVPNRADVKANGLMPENVVMFVNTATNKVHVAFKGAVVSRNGENIESNQFITGDVSMMAVERLPREPE